MLAGDRETRVQLCGDLALRIRGIRCESRLPGRQGVALLAYLVVDRHRAVPRAELADAVWSASPPDALDAALRALLSKLRAAVGADLLVGRSAIRLVLPDDAWVDVEAAREAVHRAEAAVALRRWGDAWAPGRVALSIASRELLPAHDAGWIEARREELEAIRIRALGVVVRCGMGLGGSELVSGERAARELLRAAPLDEEAHRLLMEVLAARGEGAQALRLFEQLRGRLRDELGIAPSPETLSVHRRLLTRAPHDGARASGG